MERKVSILTLYVLLSLSSYIHSNDTIHHSYHIDHIDSVVSFDIPTKQIHLGKSYSATLNTYDYDSIVFCSIQLGDGGSIDVSSLVVARCGKSFDMRVSDSDRERFVIRQVDGQEVYRISAYVTTDSKLSKEGYEKMKRVPVQVSLILQAAGGGSGILNTWYLLLSVMCTAFIVYFTGITNHILYSS